MSYDQYDELHNKFLWDYFAVPRDKVINHTVGSSEAFVRLALSGAAYCLIPRLQIISELESGALINMTPDFMLSYPIFGIIGSLKRASYLKLAKRSLLMRKAYYLNN